MTQAFPAQLEVVVEVPRFGVIKRREDGRIAIVSPLPCPFNYGSVPATRAPDGDREDALILGRRLPTGTRGTHCVLGRVLFEDAGCADHKWVCGQPPLRARQRYQIELFFRSYARVKRLLNAVAGVRGATRYLGFEPAV